MHCPVSYNTLPGSNPLMVKLLPITEPNIAFFIHASLSPGFIQTKNHRSFKMDDGFFYRNYLIV
jgi:hypothetical protein